MGRFQQSVPVPRVRQQRFMTSVTAVTGGCVQVPKAASPRRHAAGSCPPAMPANTRCLQLLQMLANGPVSGPGHGIKPPGKAVQAPACNAMRLAHAGAQASGKWGKKRRRTRQGRGARRWHPGCGRPVVGPGVPRGLCAGKKSMAAGLRVASKKRPFETEVPGVSPR